MLIPTPRELVLWDVVEEHLEEAVFHFKQWRSGLFSHRFVLDQIRDGFEEPLEAHVSGLAIGGAAVAERALFPELEEMTHPHRAAVASLVLLGSRSRNLWYDLLDFLVFAQSEEHRQTIISSIALVEDPRFEAVLREAFSSARSPKEKALLLGVFAALRVDPGNLLIDCFATGFKKLDVAAVTVAGQVGRRDLANEVSRSLDSDDQDLRQAAIEAGLLLGLDKAWVRCREHARGKDHGAARSLQLIALIGRADDHHIIHDHLDDRSMRRVALWALGFAGRAGSIDRCLPYLEDPDALVAKLAAEAISTITGYTPRGEENSEPAASDDVYEPATIDDFYEPATIDETLDEAEILPEGTENLPLHDPFVIVSWWEANRSRFALDHRYLFGERHSTRALVQALRDAPMRRRHVFALELALRSGGARRVTTDAFTSRQLRELAALARIEDGGDAH